jgi:hypothetical protein
MAVQRYRIERRIDEPSNGPRWEKVPARSVGGLDAARAQARAERLFPTEMVRVRPYHAPQEPGP